MIFAAQFQGACAGVGIAGGGMRGIGVPPLQYRSRYMEWGM